MYLDVIRERYLVYFTKSASSIPSDSLEITQIYNSYDFHIHYLNNLNETRQKFIFIPSVFTKIPLWCLIKFRRNIYSEFVHPQQQLICWCLCNLAAVCMREFAYGFEHESNVFGVIFGLWLVGCTLFNSLLRIILKWCLIVWDSKVLTLITWLFLPLSFYL